MNLMNLKIGTWVRADRKCGGLCHKSEIYSSIISTSLTQYAGINVVCDVLCKIRMAGCRIAL